ncbi:uncharacterized protein [Cherax quadricarinatus]|nr:uncharacterized protein LOC128696647 [Cherax quadricarinatus]
MEVRKVMLMVVTLAWVTSPTIPHPTSIPPSTTTIAPTTVLQKSSEAGGGSSSSLWETVLRLDQMLQRPNDYNALMLESGEEDDQLSRLLYKLQEKERMRERMHESVSMFSMIPRINMPMTNNIDMMPPQYRPETSYLMRGRPVF